ncbi:MAG TPA: universal stress protein [Acidimicrobiales bacterium]|jgi:nucleotide-binding universal stress UspA family protein
MKDIQAERFHRIVAGIDGSPSSVATLEWAAEQAKLTGSSLEVMTTWQWPSSYGWAMPVPSDFDPRGETANEVSRVVKVVQDAVPDVVMRTHIVEGHPAPTLVEASHEADLLVVGSRGYGEFAGMLLGSVSEYCTHHSRCPVVIIR